MPSLELAPWSRGDTIQLARSQIGEWSQGYVTPAEGDDDIFLQRLQRSLENGIIIMAALEADMKPFMTIF